MNPDNKRERKREYQQRWEVKNPNYHREYQRKWRQDNLELLPELVPEAVQ